MKKIFILALLLFVALSFWGCPSGMDRVPYSLSFLVDFTGIKNPEIKSIKIEIKNIDKVFPKPKIWSNVSDKSTTITQTLKKENGILFDFLDERFNITTPVVNVDRIFELKIYMNNNLFLTKKITFRTAGKDIYDYYTKKVEVDNRTYVKEINSGSENRGLTALVITITDADLKNFFRKIKREAL